MTMGWGCAILAAFVPMPETAVNEDGGFVFGQNDVGTDEAQGRAALLRRL